VVGEEVAPGGSVASVEPGSRGRTWLRKLGGCVELKPPRSNVDRSAFAGFRFPPEVITLAVRWYLRYGLSYRDLEELLAERGVDVDHVTVYRWVQRFTPLFADAARPCRHATGDRWFVDETYVKVAGRWRYLYRAVDQYALPSLPSPAAVKPPPCTPSLPLSACPGSQHRACAARAIRGLPPGTLQAHHAPH